MEIESFGLLPLYSLDWIGLENHWVLTLVLKDCVMNPSLLLLSMFLESASIFI